MTDGELVKEAEKAALNSYSPYSKFKVGAALICEDDSVFTGCNVENSSFGAGICAERTAMCSAVSKGKKIFKKMAIVGISEGNTWKYTPPCGICRQFFTEFCENTFEVILSDGKEIKVYTLEKLMPFPFLEF